MHGQPRSRANTKDFEKGYAQVDWKQPLATAEKPARSVKVLEGGRYECGLKSHKHDTFAEAAQCVTGEGS